MPERRGRRPTGNYKQKTEVFSTRITADLREQLDNAAKDRGHSLSQEVEHRLRRSFLNDREVTSIFGNRRNYAVLRLISTLMEAIRNPANPNADWLDDPHAYDQLLQAIAQVLGALRPSGGVAAASQSARETHPEIPAMLVDAEGIIAAWLLLNLTKWAPAQLPLPNAAAPQQPKWRQNLPHIRDDLRDVIGRIDGPHHAAPVTVSDEDDTGGAE